MKKILDFLKEQEEKKRSWTKEETKIFQTMNDEKLKELNSTLRPPPGIKTGKIGIFVPGQVGDLAQATGVLKYMDDLFPNKKLIWFVNFPNADLLRFSPVSEVRAWLWAGNGLPINCQDYFPLLCDSNNRLNKELASKYEGTKDLEDGYFPATHQVKGEKREGIEYSNVSKMIFGIHKDFEWHPYLSWSDEEREMIKNFIGKVHNGRKVIMLEVFAGSGQGYLYNIETTKKIIHICREKLGDCCFIFSSHKHLGGENNCGISNEELFGNEDGFCDAAHFTPRQVALINEYAHLFIGISSGISVTTSAWGLRPTPKIQFCGSKICSTSAISNGNFNLITMDFKQSNIANKEFENKLEEVLDTIK